ncbi:transcription factor E2F8 [Aplochiton taeniatus]
MSSAAFESQNLSDISHTNTNHKVDVFAAPQVLRKTPKKASSHCTLPVDNPLNMAPLTTPTKGKEVGIGEPWTPTSNLKMLISAASPEIRNREKELSVGNPERGGASNSTQNPELGDEAEKQISRKEKSLGLLCHKFLARYPDYPNPALHNTISLDDVATELNVERRRIYDIMNVLESLHMVSRLAKNCYIWHGRAKLAQTLTTLRQVGEKHRYGPQMIEIRQRYRDREFYFDVEEKENEEGVDRGEQGKKEMSFVEIPGVEFRAASVNSRKDKSLRVMSQKFVMLFLVSSPRVVNLEVAARILIGEDHVANQDKNKFKTKVRRLYDIANVLRSLKLIEKVHVTEERGRKPAFEWIGPEDFHKPEDVETFTSAPSSTAQRVMDSRASVDNCAKNLFSSPRAKLSFTRHPSLIKLAKSIQDDRRKINSAPTSPVKYTLNDSSNNELDNSKMAQLATICKIQLDQQSRNRDKDVKPACTEALACLPQPEENAAKVTQPPVSTPTESHATPVHLVPQPQFPAQHAATLAYVPAKCSPLIPVLLPQCNGAGAYPVYLYSSHLRPHPVTRPQPTSLAVRSMTFEDKSGRGPCEAAQSPVPSQQPSGGPEPSSPSVAKRVCVDRTTESSPSKTKRLDPSSRDTSPKLCEILQARMKARRGGLLTNRPSPRALHLDPEFVNTPGSRVANPLLEQSVETFLEKADKVATSDNESGLTPIRGVAHTQGPLHTETLIPAGYLIPLSQQSLFSYKDLQCPNKDSSKASTPPYNVYHTPTAGTRPQLVQEFTPTSVPLQRAPTASPFPAQGHRIHSPSPAILNFTLQNLGLIPGPCQGSAQTLAQTPERLNSLLSPLPTHLGLHPQGMMFVKPMSPATVQQSLQPLTLYSLQQPLMATPKGTGLPQQSFFHTPVSLSPLATVVTSGGHVAGQTVYIPQRKLEVSTEEA